MTLIGLTFHLCSKGSGRGLVVRVLDSGLKGRGLDPHTGHSSLLKLRQFHLPQHCWEGTVEPLLYDHPPNHIDVVV